MHPSASRRRRHSSRHGRSGQAHEDLRRHHPDLTFISALKKLTSRNTDGLIGAVAAVMGERYRADRFDDALSPLLAKPGVLTRRAPSDEEQQDFEFGYRMADVIAGLDIGQTIAVKHRAVVAVEAMEAPMK